jgi:FkbM family methyltransferase
MVIWRGSVATAALVLHAYVPALARAQAYLYTTKDNRFECGRPKWEILLHAIIGGLFAENVVPPGSILDVGANDGEMSCFYATLDPSRKVHALEPNIHTFRTLELNMRSATKANIRTMNAGVSSHDRKYDPGRSNELVIGSRTAELPSFPVYRVDSLFGATQQGSQAGQEASVFPGEQLGFWHIDVEWHELEALRGGVATVRRDQPFFTAEVHVHEKPAYTRKLAEFIEGLGYSMYLTDEICGVRIDCRNLLCIPAASEANLVASSHTLTLAIGSGVLRRVTSTSIFEAAPTPRSFKAFQAGRTSCGRDTADAHFRHGHVKDPIYEFPRQN